jgi:hypothetical protein
MSEHQHQFLPILAATESQNPEAKILLVPASHIKEVINAHLLALDKALESVEEAIRIRRPSARDWGQMATRIRRLHAHALGIKALLGPGPFEMTVPEWYAVMNRFSPFVMSAEDMIAADQQEHERAIAHAAAHAAQATGVDKTTS